MSTTTFQRETFRTSRLLDFCSETELTAQTGHNIDEWPLVLIKEILDNALDACEEAGVAPYIEIIVDDGAIVMRDNGPGIPADVIDDILDFSIRVSSREAYVAPTRGAQGNALKTIFAMPFVLDGERGFVEIDTQGQLHSIEFAVDHIAQEPVISREVRNGHCKSGTEIRIIWPESACSNLDASKARFLQIADDFTWLNPHLTLNVTWKGEQHSVAATNSEWTKWKPSDATSVHWYGTDHLQRLIAAYITHGSRKGECRTVREFISEFRGLSGTAKQKAVLKATGLSHESLTCLTDGERLNQEAVERLLSSMKEQSKPVKPEKLGVIGKDHMRRRFEALNCEMESFDYKKVVGIEDDIPWVVETAFAWNPNMESRRLVTGVNWSPGIVNPFRTLGPIGTSLDTVLSQQRVNNDEPVILALHMACARVRYTDRGKSAVVVNSWESDKIIGAVNSVTKKWAKQRKREERQASASINRRYAMTYSSRTTIKKAAWEIMEEAYMKASENDTLPALARQIMYAARPYILEQIDSDTMDDVYFTQTLLPDYLKETGVKWNVAYDPRGNLYEPHTSQQIPLGTLQIREHIRAMKHFEVTESSYDIRENLYPTYGPNNRYSAILFIEKEGFLPLLNAVKLEERYDVALMSTKGMSVIAARVLADSVCSYCNVPLLVVRDFDKSGFSIVGTLKRETRRYRFKNKIEVIDLGLRLEDIGDLQSEPVSYGKSSKSSVIGNLRTNGATMGEVEFLVDMDKDNWVRATGQRVELNAFTSSQIVAWIEGKLDALGIKKLVPDDEVLADAYRRATEQATVQKIIDKAVKEFCGQEHEVIVPNDLRQRVNAGLDKDRKRPWCDVLRDIAEGDVT